MNPAYILIILILLIFIGYTNKNFKDIENIKDKMSDIEKKTKKEEDMKYEKLLENLLYRDNRVTRKNTTDWIYNYYINNIYCTTNIIGPKDTYERIINVLSFYNK